MFGQLRELAGRHEIVLVCCDVPQDREPIPFALRAVEVVERSPCPSWRRLLRMVGGLPPWVAQVSSLRMRARVRQIALEQSFDAVLLYELNAVQYCPAELRPRALVNVEDPQHLKFRRMRELSVWSRAQRVTLAIHAWMLGSYERRSLGRFGRVLMLSEADARDFSRPTSRSSVAAVPYGVEAPPASDLVPFAERRPGMVVFSGNMFHPPNVDAMLFFLADIFPGILREDAQAQLYVVGADPDPRIRSAAAAYGDHVLITGRVPSVSDYLRKAMVSVCPVRLPIGVQTKVLEALACGTPVVTTFAGNRGIGGVPGRDLWAEDEPEAFGRRVASLLRGEHWQEMAAGGRRLVTERFTWARSAEALEREIVHVSGAA